MALCNPGSLSKQERTAEMDRLWGIFQQKGNINKRFTHMGFFNKDAAANMFKNFIEQRLELPFDSETPFNAGHFRRMEVEINSWNRALGGKFANFAFLVPEGISKQDPTTRSFYLRLGEILNHERTNISNLMVWNRKVADHMLEAYIATDNQATIFNRKRQGNTAIKELRQIRKDLENEDGSGNKSADFIAAMKDFIASDQGTTIRQFNHLMELSNGDFKKARNEKFTDTREFLDPGINKEKNDYFNQEIKFNPHTYRAAEYGRKLTLEMGKIYINGLKPFRELIALRYANTRDVKKAMAESSKAEYLIKKIDEHIKKMNELTKTKDANGGYFPHMTFDTIIEIKARMAEAMDANLSNRDATFDSTVDAILKRVNLDKVPAHVRERGTSLGRFWEKDPQFVLNEYGHQAIQFNKVVHTQINYLDALRHIPKSENPTKFVKGLKRFIEEEYTVFTHGTSGRPAWVNNIVMSLNALQTARTMGINITGGVKNFLSAAHFYSRVGLKSLKNARADYKNEEGTVGQIMRSVEREQGFKFSDAAQELYTEGLITKTEFDTGEYRFNPETGKLMKGNTYLKDFLINAGKYTLDKALFFHRITENSQRKWMFRTAFHKKFTYLVDQGYSEGKAAEFAKRFALQSVNGWAYEYAAYAKAKSVRGEGRVVEELQDGTIRSQLVGVAGGMSEAAMHLMHYPMSLVETQWSNLKGAGKALLAKQGFSDSEEMQYFARYAGTSLLVSLVSVLTNTNLFNLFENETQQRLTRVINDITEAENPDRGTFGLLSEFTGTNLGTLKHLMITGGIIDIDNSTLNKIIFGNVDFADPDDKLTELYSAYQYSTAWGVYKNKVQPALESGRGRDLITHYLKLYPSDWTKAAHKKLPWSKQKKKSISQNVRNPYDKRAIAVLDSMLRR